jgi:hypothetical protein
VNHRIITIATFLAILILGSYFRLESLRETILDAPLRADAGQYFAYAYNLRHHHTYSRDLQGITDSHASVSPDALRSPGYPLFLLPFVSDPPNWTIIYRILLAQTILSILTLVVCYFTFRSMLPWGWASVACALTAISPHLIVSNSYILTESLCCFSLVWVGWLMSLFIKRQSLWMAAFLGMSIAVSSHIRPGFQYFSFFLIVFVICQVRPVNYRWRAGAFVLGGFLLLLCPWIVRNVVSLHTTSDTSLMRAWVHHGVFPNFMYENRRETFGYPYRFDPQVNQIESSVSSVLAEVVRRFREKPGEHLRWFLIGKPIAFWSWSCPQGAGDVFIYPVRMSPYFSNRLFQVTHAAMHNSNGILVLFMAIGCIMAWLPEAKLGLAHNTILMARFVSLFLLYFVGVHMVGFPISRYSVPLRPYLYAMACFAPYAMCSTLRTLGLPARKSHSVVA